MNAQDVLKYGHLWVHRHLEGLTEAQMQAPGVCGVWSVREIVAHLASFEWMLVDVMMGFIDPGPTPTLDSFTGLGGHRFNDVEVERRKDQSVAQTVAEYDEAYDRVKQALPRIDREELRRPGTLPWYGMEYSLEDLIVYQYYGHKREHMAQVAVYRDTLER